MSQSDKAWYHLVEWEKEEGEERTTVSIIPDSWLVMGTNTCKWPRNATTQLIKRNPLPQASWGTYPYAQVSIVEVFLTVTLTDAGFVSLFVCLFVYIST